MSILEIEQSIEQGKIACYHCGANHKDVIIPLYDEGIEDPDIFCHVCQVSFVPREEIESSMIY